MFNFTVKDYSSIYFTLRFHEKTERFRKLMADFGPENKPVADIQNLHIAIVKSAKYIVKLQTQIMFWFNHENFDFWSIYNTIVHFYPIGIKNDESKLFFDHPGYKELRKIIEDEIHDHAKYEQWELFTRQIAKELGKLMMDTTNIMSPALSSYIEIEKRAFSNLTRTKELNFYVSLLGPFYTVFGKDSNMVVIDDNKKFYSTNYFVTSPENDFAEGFKMLCEKIELQFKGFRFVPHNIYRRKIESLFIHNCNENEACSVFNALFNNSVDFDNTETLGNDFYKSEDWIKEGYLDTGGKWASYPPGDLPR